VPIHFFRAHIQVAGAAEALNAAIDGCRARCGALRVDFRLATTDRTPAAFLNELLAERKRLGA